jgi:hypothetical protein
MTQVDMAGRCKFENNSAAYIIKIRHAVSEKQMRIMMEWDELKSELS